ncbi:cupin domain-containing protein [Paraburkholderia tropica]|uniref:cupin domain-containing protein n=1 Tax=Paraburkholderia tropica TaxID=92647 RepID=UPI002AB6BB82|nr:cupin domain-containing protein [Paraburkholderia tropica]
MSMETHLSRHVRRLVTGSRADGSSYLVDESGASANPVKGLPGLIFHEVWRTSCAPSPLNATIDAAAPLRLSPETGGTVIRVCDIPPDAALHGPDVDIEAHFAEIGMVRPEGHRAAARHALMHQTDTIDYGILLDGELWLVLDESETRLSPGDVVVQRGTRHAWSNRSERPARIAFILIDAKTGE